MRAALLACVVALGCDEASPVVGDAPADAWTYIDAPACDRELFDAGPGDRTCNDGELLPCDRLLGESCDAWGCCPHVYVINADRNRCCKVYVSGTWSYLPCCHDSEVLWDPGACPRCEKQPPPQ